MAQYAYEFRESTYYSTFIVGSSYVTVLSHHTSLDEIFEAVMEFVDQHSLKKPFVMLNSMCVHGDPSKDYLIDNEVPDILLGV